MHPGTAAANLHPAVLEADHARTPLLVLTADRPPELRGTGANQATDQLKLYGQAVRWFCEVGVPGDDPAAGRYWRSLASRAWAEASGPPPAGPPQPRLRRPAGPAPPAPAAGGWPRLGGAPAPGRPGGAPWTAAPGRVRAAAPGDVAALAEAVRANLGRPGRRLGVGPGPRGGRRLRRRQRLAGPRRPAVRVAAGPGRRLHLRRPGLRPRFAAAHRPTLAVRVGAAPTSKALTAWLDESIGQVVVDPAAGWLDPARTATLRLTADPSALLAATATLLAAQAQLPLPAPTGPAPGSLSSSPWLREWLEADRAAREAIDGLLDEWAEPFEGRVARDLVGWMPAGGTLVVGSSMPVRDVDAFARPREGLRFVANRGLSGIDGFVATALGVAAAEDEPVAALCGDLALLHDASGLLGAAGRPRGAVLVVCDNDGGGIFSFLPQAELPGDLFEPLFGTPHGLDLMALAAAARVPARGREGRRPGPGPRRRPGRRRHRAGPGAQRPGGQPGPPPGAGRGRGRRGRRQADRHGAVRGVRHPDGGRRRAEIHLRLGGDGPPLLLLHGYPQTSAMWHRVAPGLAERFTVVAADLRGYGRSSRPPSDPDHLAYSKRAMALGHGPGHGQLGFGAFAVAGHDRGGRVGYRMALDHPEVVTRLAVLDIVPTHVMWQRMDRELAMATYHWLFLAQPDGLPETLIGADPAWWVREKLRRWAGDPGGVRARGAGGVRALLRRPGRRPRLLRGLPGRGGRRRPARRRRSGPAAHRLPGAGPVGRRRDRPPGRGPARLLASLVRRPPRPGRPRRPLPPRGIPGRDAGRPARLPQGLSSTSSMARSLCSVSAHSASGSEPGTTPAPAIRWARRPARVAQRMATAHSPPARSTQPTGPA